MSEALEVASHESELGSWETVRRLPHPALRPLVYGYAGYFSKSPGAIVRRHLPGCASLIFMFEPRFEVLACGHRDDAIEVQHAFVAGLHDSFAVTRSPGFESGLQVDFTPLSARAILGMPMHLLSGRAIEAGEVFGPESRRLAEQLRDAPDWESRFDAVDSFLLRRLACFEGPNGGVAWAYSRILKAGGNVPIHDLAEQLDWGHRRLVSGFRDEVGLAPKTVARVVRFNRALRMAERDPVRSWADIAAAAGYYDQPHLVREFVALSGSTPTDLAARILPASGGVEG